MNPTTTTAWPLLVARLRHLLAAEGYGRSRSRFPGNVQAVMRARTGRHLVALGPDSLERLRRDWAEIAHLAIWPDLRRLTLAHDEQGPRPAPLAPLGPSFDEPLLDPRHDDPRSVTRQLVRRLAYLCREEFDDGPLGLLTLSRAWLDLRSVRTLDAQLLEAYLDSTDATERRVIRFCLRDLQWGMDWESATDAELFRGVADRMDRYPLTLAAALPAQIERFRRAGLLSAAFDRSPSAVVASATGATAAGAGAWSGEPAAVPAELYELAGGRFVIDRPFPGSRGRSLDVGIDRESGDRVLVTKLFVLDDEPIPSEAELMPAHEGISTLLHLGRVDLADGLANVMVEALPDAMRSDERLPLGLDQSLALADRVAAILGTVHAAGHCVTGLRPELTFVDARDQVTLVPRGDLLRRLTWPAGPKIEGQLPPFRDLYLAPELLLGQHATAASDVYSLCAMLACWIRSVHPFARDSAAAQLQAMLNDSPDCRGLPVPLYGTVALGLSAEPGRRPTLAEFRRALGGRHPA